MNAIVPKRPRNNRAEEIKRLRDELDDVTVIAEQFVNLVTCKGGRTINHPDSGYTCFICGADRTSGEPCRGSRK